MRYNQRVTIDELINILKKYKYKEFQIHHTWLPNYDTFYQKDKEGKRRYTPEKLNDNMKSFHIGKGFGDIAQHITTFPDGTILIGRDFGKKPVGIANRNTGGFCMEQLGDFDLGKDIITVEQRNITLRLIEYFSSVGTKPVFHRQFSSKSCPGTSLHLNGLIDASKYYFKTGDLRKWITGADVAELQRKLGVKVVDGSYGNDTEVALKSYQAKNGLSITGIYDKTTRDFMNGKENDTVEDKKEEKISDWSYPEIDQLVKRGIVKGDTNGNIRPRENITREECFVAINRAVNYIVNSCGLNEPDFSNNSGVKDIKKKLK